MDRFALWLLYAEKSVRILTAAPLFWRGMIELTDDDIAEFQTLFLKETGKEITKEQAASYATNLVSLLEFVTRSGNETVN